MNAYLKVIKNRLPNLPKSQYQQLLNNCTLTEFDRQVIAMVSKRVAVSKIPNLLNCKKELVNESCEKISKLLTKEDKPNKLPVDYMPVSDTELKTTSKPDLISLIRQLEERLEETVKKETEMKEWRESQVIDFLELSEMIEKYFENHGKPNMTIIATAEKIELVECIQRKRV